MVVEAWSRPTGEAHSLRERHDQGLGGYHGGAAW
jgi:hypothetical protein